MCISAEMVTKALSSMKNETASESYLRNMTHIHLSNRRVSGLEASVVDIRENCSNEERNQFKISTLYVNVTICKLWPVL